MAQNQAELVKNLVDAGVHFGHRVSRWNPKMEPYIHGKRNMIHIIDVKETVKGLLRAKRLITQMVASGKDVLFVGTKRQARMPLKKKPSAVECTMFLSVGWVELSRISARFAHVSIALMNLKNCGNPARSKLTPRR